MCCARCLVKRRMGKLPNICATAEVSTPRGEENGRSHLCIMNVQLPVLHHCRFYNMHFCFYIPASWYRFAPSLQQQEANLHQNDYTCASKSLHMITTPVIMTTMHTCMHSKTTSIFEACKNWRNGHRQNPRKMATNSMLWYKLLPSSPPPSS